jgi:hypothetical protein
LDGQIAQKDSMCIPFHIYFGLDWFFYWEGVIGCSAGNWHFGILSPSSLPCPPLLAPYIICPFPPCQFGSFSQYHLTINPMNAPRLRPFGFPPAILFGFFFLCLTVQIQAQYYNNYYNPYSYYNYNNYYRPYSYNNNNYYSSYYNPYYYNNNNNYYNYNRGSVTIVNSNSFH